MAAVADVLDPAYVLGRTGTPEPDGLIASELLAMRTVAAELDVVGGDVV